MLIAGVVPPLDSIGVVPVTLVIVPLPLLLNVVQSVELNAPLLLADAVGTFNVITGVVVPLATVLVKSVPLVPNVIAATLVTVPLPVAIVQLLFWLRSYSTPLIVSVLVAGT